MYNEQCLNKDSKLLFFSFCYGREELKKKVPLQLGTSVLNVNDHAMWHAGSKV